MYEFMRSNVVAEVQDGVVKYFKEYTQRGKGVIFRKEVAYEDYVRGNPYEYSKEARILQTNELVSTLSSMVNGNNFDFTAFYNSMRSEHRYLQGEIANLVIRWLIEAASNENYGFDARNELIQIAGNLLKTRF